MKKVTFKQAFDHITPTRTVAYPAGYAGEVPNDAAEAAEASGKLEASNGGRSDKAGTKGNADASEG